VPILLPKSSNPIDFAGFSLFPWERQSSKIDLKSLDFCVEWANREKWECHFADLTQLLDVGWCA
jgi:hypothetical protein